MAPLAFHGSKCRLAVVTTAAEFPLIDSVHIHVRSTLFELKDGGMTVSALEHGSMELMAEDRGSLSFRLVLKLLLERRHFVAFYTGCSCKSLFAVMTTAAGLTPVHHVHGNF